MSSKDEDQFQGQVSKWPFASRYRHPSPRGGEWHQCPGASSIPAARGSRCCRAGPAAGSSHGSSPRGCPGPRCAGGWIQGVVMDGGGPGRARAGPKAPMARGSALQRLLLRETRALCEGLRFAGPFLVQCCELPCSAAVTQSLYKQGFNFGT